MATTWQAPVAIVDLQHLQFNFVLGRLLVRVMENALVILRTDVSVPVAGLELIALFVLAPLILLGSLYPRKLIKLIFQLLASAAAKACATGLRVHAPVQLDLLVRRATECPVQEILVLAMGMVSV